MKAPDKATIFMKKQLLREDGEKPEEEKQRIKFMKIGKLG
jgi:hypothetical protein